MNGRLPEALGARLGNGEEDALAQAWSDLDRALRDAPSRRMQRRFNRVLRRERRSRRIAPWRWAGLGAMLVVGFLVGRFVMPVPERSAELDLEISVIGGRTTAARLEAILHLRDAAELPPSAMRQLEQLIVGAGSSVGMRLAAAEALAAHRHQPEVQDLLRKILAANGQNPAIADRLREASESSATVSL